MINPRIDLKQSVISSPPLHFAARRNVNGVMQRRNTMYHNPAADEELASVPTIDNAFISQGAIINNLYLMPASARWIFPPANTPGHNLNDNPYQTVDAHGHYQRDAESTST